MKILSFNVREWSRDTKKNSDTYWKDRMKCAEKMIEDVKPDVLCFQELSIPANFTIVPEGYKRCGIMINHPIYVRRDYSTKSGSWGIHYSKVTVGNDIRIINIHSHWNPKVISKTMDMIQEEFIDFPGIVIACGDFNNTTEQIAAIEIKKDKTWSSVRESFDLPEVDTFQNWTKPESHGEIDHFYTNTDCASSYTMITDGYGAKFRLSDHYPIMIEI